MKPLLTVDQLHVRYGNIHAVKGISLSVGTGEIVSLIGSNGAGKTSILRALSGLLPCEGRLELDGHSISKVAPQERVRRGLIHCPEGRGIFSDMTVQENLMLGAYLQRDRKQIAEIEGEVLTLFPRLKERLKQIAGTLSGGEQQMLAISRALLSRPKVLLLDEPSLGLAPIVVQQIFSIIQSLNQKGMTIFLVEQNANVALSLAHRAYVLQTGSIVLSGTGRELLTSPDVQKHYLGL